MACALLLLMTGCNDRPGVTTPTAPSSPPAPNVSGHWSAVLSGLDAAAANGRLAVTFDHRHLDAERGLLLGTWSLMFPDQSERSGSVSGTVTGVVAMIELTPVPRLHCQNALDALLAGALSLQVTMGSDQLNGTIRAYTCESRSDSTIELRR